MGRISKWIARKGAVGGTARWAGKMYRLISTQKPELERHEVFRAMVAARYNTMPNPAHERQILANMPRVGSLMDLVAWILTAEAGFAENTPENIEMFFEVIQEELRRFGLSEEEIRGTSVMVAISRFLARRYLNHHQEQPGAPDAAIFEKVIEDMYPDNEQARAHLISRLPQTEGLGAVAIGAAMIAGAVDELSLNAAGDVMQAAMLEQGLSVEQVYGKSFVENAKREVREELIHQMLGAKKQ